VDEYFEMDDLEGIINMDNNSFTDGYNIPQPQNNSQ
jgi:hypothetical protein